MKCVLVACLTAGLVLAAAAPTDEERRLWRDHLLRFRRAVCSGPIERVVSLEELHVSSQSGELFSPPGSVLHRCDHHHSFCCRSGESWGPAETEAVPLVFQVRNLVTSTIGTLTVTATNHTRCECHHTAAATSAP